MPAPIRVSTAAAALHPGLEDAIRIAGGTIVQADNDVAFAIFSDIEPASGRRSAVVGRSARARIDRTGDAPCLAFAPHDLRFAAAVIVALATSDDAPAAADPATVALHTLAARVAARDVAVLVTGPTGTGKEVLSRFIHASSARANAPFIAVNCAALPEAMLEALLFGHERGAFTGAGAASPGLFRAANRGTLLLDEIAEMPIGLQAKLLRVLQEREVLPIGATVAQAVDVRIVATANRDLAAEVAAGRFRGDLFYRLAVFPLATTALATRRPDIVPVAAALWLRHGGEAWPSGAALSALLVALVAALAVVAAIDLPIAIARHLAKLRMSKQEVREENRESEGSPETKAAQRRLARAAARRALAPAMAEATVVTVNPAHFAIALRYVPGRDAAPIVVAKGRDIIAAAIRDLAAERAVPVLSYPQLTRAIFFTGKVGAPIRDDLFAAVAAVLAFVFSLDRAARAQPDIDLPDALCFDERGRL